VNAEHPDARKFGLIALDLDGTLLNDEGRVSQADAAALKQFAHAGGTVALASGRMTDRIRPFNHEMGTDGPVISYNGAVARTSEGEGSEAIFERPLPAQYADELIEYTRREGLLLNYYLDEQLYTYDSPELRRFADIYSQQTGAVYHFVPDLDRFRGCEPAKCIIVTDPTDPERPNPRGRDELYEVWHAKWDSEVTVMRTNPEYLEFYSRQAGKGNALEALARRYGVPRSLTLAFGDNLNDVTMLEWAGRGVAVANANPDAKAAADWVSPLTNDESPVADALRRMLPGLRLA
jgi:hypothetical protein